MLVSCAVTLAPRRLLLPQKKEQLAVVRAPRIGVTKAANTLLRFYVKGNEFVSRVR